MILHRRSQLIKWLEENAPTASIRRAVGEGSVEFLGWFSAFQGSEHPGWIIKVVSTITGKVWNVVVRKSIPRWYYAWIMIEDIPWKSWNPPDSNVPFMQGDNPEIYRKNRENVKAQGCSEIYQEDISS